MVRIELEPIVEYELNQYAKKYELNQNELQDLFKELIIKQDNINIYSTTASFEEDSNDDEGHSDQWRRGYREGWDDCEEAASIDFGVCPY
jgi:hypothetical protein